MRNNLKYLGMVFAVSAFCASSVQAATDGATSKKRTWAEYAALKKKALLAGSADERELANAQLQLGTAQMQADKAAQQVKKQEERTKKQAEDLKVLDATRAQLKNTQDKIAGQKAVADDLKKRRSDARIQSQSRALPVATATFQGSNIKAGG